MANGRGGYFGGRVEKPLTEAFQAFNSVSR